MSGIQPGWGKQWETLADAINGYYGGGVGSTQYQQVVQMLNSGEYTMEEMESILGNIPEFTTTYNSAGQLTGVSYNATSTSSNAASSVAQQINSNVQSGTNTQFSTVQTITKDSQTGKVTMSDNLVKYKTGQLAPTTMKGVAISGVQALMASAAGITVGKGINQLAYDLGFNWLEWAGVGMEELNPETWATITEGDDSVPAKLFNMILGLDENNNPQPYMDENALAYMVAYMGAVGAFDTSPKTVYSDEFDIPILEDNSFFYYNNTTPPPAVKARTNIGIHDFELGIPGNDYEHCAPFLRSDGYPQYPNIDTLYSSKHALSQIPYDEFTHDDKTVYYTSGNSGSSQMICYEYLSTVNPASLRDALSIPTREKLAWILEYGSYSGGGIDGIYDEPEATVFNASGINDWTDIASVLAALKTQYPELWENRVEVSPDGDTTLTYIPTGFPTGGTGQYPTTEGATQSQLAPDITGDGDNASDELIKTLIDMITHPYESEGMESDTTTPTKPIDPNGDPRGTGSTPPIVVPVGSASALWKIYNPSQSQLDAFGAWLWSSDFVDQLLKLFNDPMQAIIGLHKVFCTPPTNGSGPIKVGYLVSDASAKYVSNQYTEIDCGTVNIQEHFNNVFDYDEFTRISIYLPFIGFKDLDVKDIMRSTINVKYGIDVLTGACLAKITVTRDLNSPILYTFAGNCAVQYPVSSGSYIGIITGLCSIIGGVAGSIATGGALAPALVGATAGLPRMHATVEHSGSISSNAGAMGPKKPYIVIQRPQTKMPLNGIMIEGKGQNETVTLGTLTGYVKVKKADLMGIPATGSELDEIRDLLESGIYMN